ncbi:hypothetical protein PLICRDRAFT_39997 [Plicaturopsis crispa FD-325 SS-3]|nr:hypothetical protein PLICRDRAFT_39997 [Plicaturopsis crispa FD-325 SS-3]
MSSVFRAVTKHSRALSRASRTASAPVPIRAFHSPFAVLGSTPNNTLPPSSELGTAHYEKQLDHSSEPLSQLGVRTYVVSEPDPANTPYAVPSGAYPTSEPYVHAFTPTEAPDVRGQQSSTSSGLAHPFTTRAAPQNESGVGESAAVRHSAAPGAMGGRGAGYGGLGLMDKEGTVSGEGELASRNPQPDSSAVAGKFSKAGVDGAWELRK